MKAYVVKFPEKSMAPPTLVRAGKLMAVRSVLLAIWLAPPTVFNRGMEMFVRRLLATNAKLPSPVAKSPTVVKFGALMDFMKLP